MKIIAATHVVPISSPPIKNGAVAYEDGKILGVGRRANIEVQFPGTEVEDLGNAAIMPGLVNCHSHLEITGLRSALDSVEHDFRSWLLRLNDLRSRQSEEAIYEAAFEGAIEGAQAGVTCFGDIGRFASAGLKALKRVGLRGIVYQETEFSPDVRSADKDFATVVLKYEALRSVDTDLVRTGISPHSPYTVSSSLFELIAQYSIHNKVPITIHASESAAEVELLMNGNGFFTEIYKNFGLDWNSPGCTPIHYLERLGVLSSQPLLAHCVAVDDDDIKRISNYGATIAHCPKSNAKFGHGYAPLEAFLENDIDVGLGSDSVASNNICDLFEESRFAAFAARNRAGTERFTSASDVIEIATLGGARALRMGDSIGSLETGKLADMAVVSLNSVRQQPVTDIYATLVFGTCGSDVIRTVVGGKEVFRRDVSH